MRVQSFAVIAAITVLVFLGCEPEADGPDLRDGSMGVTDSATGAGGAGAAGGSGGQAGAGAAGGAGGAGGSGGEGGVGAVGGSGGQAGAGAAGAGGQGGAGAVGGSGGQAGSGAAGGSGGAGGQGGAGAAGGAGGAGAAGGAGGAGAAAGAGGAGGAGAAGGAGGAGGAGATGGAGGAGATGGAGGAGAAGGAGGAGGEPGACEPVDCGQAPEVAPCPDGAAPALECARNDEGACAWRVDECPPPVEVPCGGIVGADCPDDQYCEYAIGAACGDGDQQGICRARPEECVGNIELVCGCDGETYDNECLAHQMGASVARLGPCEPACDPLPEICDNNLDEDCDGRADEGCICEDADNDGTCDGEDETCNADGIAVDCRRVPPRCDVGQVPEARDGCYTNRCVSWADCAAGVECRSDDECLQPGAPGCAARCVNNACEIQCVQLCDQDEECAVNEICEDGQCGACGCPEVIEPVCGVDGNNYDNACFARCAHVAVAAQGECVVCPEADAICEAQCDGRNIEVPDECPQPDCDCRECHADLLCPDGQGCLNDACAQCPEAEAICDAVCAGDPAVPVPAGCPQPDCFCPECEDDGGCGDGEMCLNQLCVDRFCGGALGLGCPEGEICVDDPDDGCDPDAGGADCVGMCIELQCPEDADVCIGDCLGRPVDLPDGCEPPECGACPEPCDEDVVDCGDRDCNPDAILCDGNRDCENGSDEFDCADGCECDRRIDPVCGVDGNSYDNACLADCAGVATAYAGPCRDDGCGGDEDCDNGQVCVENDCVDPPECQRDVDCELGQRCSQGACENCACPAVLEPVCGSDDRSYDNECQARCNHVDVAHEGACEEEPVECPSDDEICGDVCRGDDVQLPAGCNLPACHCPDPSCGDGEYECLNGDCVPMAQRCDLSPNCADESDERNCPCPAAEVVCAARCAAPDVEPQLPQGCEAPAECPACPEPECALDVDCDAGQRCEGGECELCICPPENDPVCGVDGQRYGSPCEARCARVEVDPDGQCLAEPECPADFMPDVFCAAFCDGGPADPPDGCIAVCHCQGCADDEFRCASGQCIAGDLECDGELNCRDESDEVDCAPECPSDEAICADVCGGVDPALPDGCAVPDDCDCPDPECLIDADCNPGLRCERRQCEVCLCEAVFEPVCGENGQSYNSVCEARCARVEVVADGECAGPVCPNDFNEAVFCEAFCDGGPADPPDGCNAVCHCQGPNCGQDEVECDDGSCAARCDGQAQCQDERDESECGPVECDDDEFSCDLGRCIAGDLRCDGQPDCRDDSDELDCPPPECQADEFRCDSGQCIPEAQRCNRVDNCDDESDEEGCAADPCGNDFACDDGECIDPEMVCDGLPDCRDESDEACGANCPQVDQCGFICVGDVDVPDHCEDPGCDCDAGCQEDADCEEGQACRDGECVQEECGGVDDVACPEGQLCIDDPDDECDPNAVPEACEGDDCPDPEVCRSICSPLNCPTAATPGVCEQACDGLLEVPEGCAAPDCDCDDLCRDQGDDDGDGTPNCDDQCLEDGDKSEPGVCGCGVADADVDANDIVDCLEDCDDFNDDDQDGTRNCDDECPRDGDKVVSGECGCGVADVDVDGNDLIDCLEEGCDDFADDDNDGTRNCDDGCPNDGAKVEAGDCGCGVADVDLDDNGVLDCLENCDDFDDSDGDGTRNCDDECPDDARKVAPGECGCGVADIDDDHNGVLDCDEVCDDFEDADNDGVRNCDDECPADPNKVLEGACGCGVADVDVDGNDRFDCQEDCDDFGDADGDGTRNCDDGCPDDPEKLDAGECGCGVADVDSDHNGQIDCNEGCADFGDDDNDGTRNCDDACPADPNKVFPGDCGCGQADVDSDNDGTLDCNDECPADAMKVQPGECGCGVEDSDHNANGQLDCNEVECPEFQCELFCDFGFARDENDCEICRCNEAPDPCDGVQCADGEVCRDGACVVDCPDEQCDLQCDHGFVQDDRGCNRCECNDPPDLCAHVFCQDGEICRDGQCVVECPAAEEICGVVCRGGTPNIPDGCDFPQECEFNCCDGDRPCGDGLVCDHGRCVPPVDPCDGIVCEAGQVCDGGECIAACGEDAPCEDGLSCEFGRCVDLCDGVNCGEGEVCVAGVCLEECPADDEICDGVCRGQFLELPDHCSPPMDCEFDCCGADEPCDEGLICDEGRCVMPADPCDGVVCGQDEVCEGGACIAACGPDLPCAEGLDCQFGRCVDLCMGVECEDGFFCDGGECVEDCPADVEVCDAVCLGEMPNIPDHCNFPMQCEFNCCDEDRPCPDGLECGDGRCAPPIDPCDFVVCGAGEQCDGGECVPACPPDEQVCVAVCRGDEVNLPDNCPAPNCDCELDIDCDGVRGGDAVLDQCGVCDSDPDNDCVQDCAGEWGGDAVEDCAGECGGPAFADEGGCCAQEARDCAGECGGDAVVDCAGECKGDAVADCAGECNGDAVADCAGECNGDAVEDCAGRCGGDAVADCAGECNGDAVADCAGECNGDAVEDCAGRCGGDAAVDCAGECNGDAVADEGGCCAPEARDCAGACGGDAIPDCAGACNGAAVADCAGECNGDAIEDCAGECNGAAVADDGGCCAPEARDCDGACGGDAVRDCAGACNGAAVADCAGECNGDAVEDCAGECKGDAVEDCAGQCNGDAVEDCAGQCNGDAVADCAGECRGDAVEDCDGECGGPSNLDACGVCDANPDNDCECGDDLPCEDGLICEDGRCVQGLPQVLISEYVEGSGNNKAIELYNYSNAAVDISDCEIRVFANGSQRATSTIAAGRNAVLAPRGTLVLCNNQAAPGLARSCDVLNPGLTFNGDDAVAFGCNDRIVDAIGQIGMDPGVAWGNQPRSTRDSTMRRACNVDRPDSDGSDPFDPTDGWNHFPRDTFDDLGVHCDVDCLGQQGGDAVEDCAGECNGDAVEDCAGECNGDAVEDCAGECNGDAAFDCAGECNGDAIEDCAGECNGDAALDCAGECNGDAIEDCAGECGGDAALDCAGECNGAAVADCAGECGGDAALDCAGECNGDAIEDCAGECGGDAALDCAGECNGDAVEDCAGQCNGQAVEDECGRCDANPNNDCVQDCAGVFGGGSALDLCGVCDDDPDNDCECNDADDCLDGELCEEGQCVLDCPEDAVVCEAVCRGQVPEIPDGCGFPQNCEFDCCDEDRPCDGELVCNEGQCGAPVDPCDGVICAAGQVCEAGECIVACGPDLPCADGLECDFGRCIDPCADVQCGEDEFCRAGECLANCPADEDVCNAVCRGGDPELPDHCNPPMACEFDCCDAEENPCDGELVCEAGRCLPPIDPCDEVECAAGQVCVDGACIAACEGNDECADGEICDFGRCVDPCAGILCDVGFFCDGGQCLQECPADEEVCNVVCVGDMPNIPNHCNFPMNCEFDCCDEQRPCGNGLVCNQGQCVMGDPCMGVECGAGQDCQLGECIDLPVEENGVDFCRLQWTSLSGEAENPFDIQMEPGAQLTIYGLLYEQGMTDISSRVDANDLIIAQVGFGRNGSNANDDESWQWFDAAGNPDWDGANSPDPNNRNNDEYLGSFAAPAEGVHAFAVRFSVDGGQTWTACDSGDGASNGEGYRSINAGRLEIEIREQACEAVDDCAGVPVGEGCAPACIDGACDQFCGVEGCPDPQDEGVVYASQDPDVCDSVDANGDLSLSNQELACEGEFLAFNTHCGCGCVLPDVEILCRADEFLCQERKCISNNWVCDDGQPGGGADCIDGDDETPEACEAVAGPEDCNADNPCPEGQVCQEGQCFEDAGGGGEGCRNAEGVDDDGNCELGDICQNNQCVPVGCGNGPPCEEGQVCEGGECVGGNDGPVQCNDLQFACADGQECIPVGWRCDSDQPGGGPDCLDGSDESAEECGDDGGGDDGGVEGDVCDAQQPCAEGFECVEDVCLADQGGGADECPEGQFRCDDGSDCVIPAFICEGGANPFQDCGDGSDESESALAVCIAAGRAEAECQADCGGGGDNGGGDNGGGCPAEGCPQGQQCVNDQCIDDGGDGGGGDNQCGEAQWACNDGQCIPAAWECDGFPDDCNDGSDEDQHCDGNGGGDNGGGDDGGGDDGGGDEGGGAQCPDPNDENVIVFSDDPATCLEVPGWFGVDNLEDAAPFMQCAANAVVYNNDCGCGCIAP